MERRRNVIVVCLCTFLLIVLSCCAPLLSGDGMTTGASASSKTAHKQMTAPKKKSPVFIAQWEEGYTLPVSVPPLLDGGLELPIVGASGYATVEMSLWETRQKVLLPPEPPKEERPLSDQNTDHDRSPIDESPSDDEGIQSDGTDEPAQGVESGDIPQDELPEVQPGDPPPEQPPAEEPAEEGAEFAIDDELVAAPEAPDSESARSESTGKSDVPREVARLKAGAAFTVLEERGAWWRVETKNGETGWLLHRYCMVNLPDVIPSIRYDIANAEASRFVSSGKALPGITGERLYTGKTYNARLGREEYMAPVLYTMAKHLAQAQHRALSEGNCIVLIEGYRPYQTQRAVAKALSALAKQDKEVYANITQKPWSIGWFIAQGTSNHQRGYAVDVTLAKVDEAAQQTLGGYPYVEAERFAVYRMPSAIHELSAAAALFTAPVAEHSSAWKTASYAPTVNAPARALQAYCTGAGLTPLASEWWHFNDPAARAEVTGHRGAGDFEITECLSRPAVR